ncbi:MAG: nitroreductase family protein [Oscillospiraceae bacterium]
MANDFLTLIMTRRSIRAYKPDAVPADVLRACSRPAPCCPSAMGKQSATIVAVETKAYRDRLAKLNAAVIGKDVDPYYGAPVIVVVLGDGESAKLPGRRQLRARKPHAGRARRGPRHRVGQPRARDL